jgi:hypothetical protein
VTWEPNIRVSDVSSGVAPLNPNFDPVVIACYHGAYDQQVQDGEFVYIVWSDDRNLVDFHADPDVWFEKEALDGEVEPSPDLKANGSDACPVVVPPGNSVELTLSVDAGDYVGTPCEWWFGFMSIYGTYWWIPGTQIPLADIRETILFDIPLPTGIWTFFIILDDNLNDAIDVTWYDVMTVVTQ